jgi:hypothetical protein
MSSSPRSNGFRALTVVRRSRTSARRTRSSTLLLGVALIGLIQSFAAPAGAQTQDAERATARLAARDGIEAVLEGRYSEGVAFLERAESMVPAPTHLLDLARGYDKLGKLVRSRELYLRLTKEDLPPSSPKAFREAQAAAVAELAKLEPRVPFVLIEVKAENAAGVNVSEDGVGLAAGLVGIKRPADPGTHTYAASADGFEAASATVMLREGSDEIVTLTLRRVRKAAGAVPPADGGDRELDVSGTEASRGGFGLRTWGFVAIGAGALSAGVGGYFLVKAVGDQSDANELYDNCRPGGCSPDQRQEVVDRDERALNGRRAAIGFFAGGALALGTGITLLLTAPASSTETAGVKPWVGLNSAGVIGRF